MKRFIIEVPEPSDEIIGCGFDLVDEDGRRANGLNFDEMLGQVIALTHPKLDGQPLATLLREADSRRAALEAERVARSARARQLVALDEKIASAARKIADAAGALEGWQRAWREALAAAGRNAGDGPDVVRNTLRVLDDLRVELATARDLDGRIAKIEEDVLAFEHAAAALAALVPGDAARTPDEITTALVEGLERMKDVRARRQTLEIRRDQQRHERQQRDIEVAVAAARVERLQQVAHCADADGVRAAVERTRVKAALERRREEEHRKLSEAGDGIARERLEADCSSVDRDSLLPSSDGLKAKIEDAQEALRALDLELAKAREGLDGVTGGAVAESAAIDRQLAAAEMSESAQRYVRVRAAARLLAWVVDRHRQEKQAPLLRRAAEIFRTLTLDSFVALAVHMDDHDRQALVGVRAQGARVPVDGMSDGARDQLYLALRLAAVEEHVAKERPLPFVADDLLVNFDDERAAAGFRALAALARRTQVLFFTHHAHLGDVVRATLGNDTPVSQI